MYRKKLLNKDASRKQAKQAVKEYRKELKQSEKAKKTTLKDIAFDDDVDRDQYWLTKGMRYGGGFYGLTALWTLFVLEVQSLWRLIVGLPAFMEDFSGGVIDLIFIFLKNQMSNFASAFTWFFHWSDGFSIAFVLLAYLGYLGGIKLAKRWDVKELVSKLKNR